MASALYDHRAQMQDAQYHLLSAVLKDMYDGKPCRTRAQRYTRRCARRDIEQICNDQRRSEAAQTADDVCWWWYVVPWASFTLVCLVAVEW